jgi:hypothetical protein
MFEVDRSSYSEVFFEPPASDAGRVSTAERATAIEGLRQHRIGRGAVIATAVDRGGSNEKFERELSRRYRNPGLDTGRMGWR